MGNFTGLSETIKDTINIQLSRGRMYNILLGENKPEIDKKRLLIWLCDEMDYDYIIIDDFSELEYILDNKKQNMAIIIENIYTLGKYRQAKIRNYIEEYPSLSFLLTASDTTNVIDAVLDRCRVR